MAPKLKIKITDLGKDRRLLAALQAYADRDGKGPYVAYLTADTMNPDEVVPEFLLPGAPSELTYNKAIQKAVVKAMSPRFKEMTEGFNTARGEIEALVNTETLHRLASTPEYEAYLAKNPRAPHNPKFEDVKKKKALRQLAVALARKEYNIENFDFLLDKGKNEHLFRTYIGDDAPSEINISSATKRTIMTCTEPDTALLKKAAKAVWKDVVKRIETKMLPAFIYSQEFIDYAVATKKIDDPKKTAKAMNIKRHTLLGQMMAVRYAGDNKGADKLAKQIEKAEKKLTDSEMLAGLGL